MEKVVCVKFDYDARAYYLSPGDLNIKKNDLIVVNFDNVFFAGKSLSDVYELDNKNLNLPLINVDRIATLDDINTYNNNILLSKDAVLYAEKISKKLNLNIKIIDSCYSLDNKQLFFNFISDDRIDFREFAKKLAQKYKTRIELRQVGVRDAAKKIGGLGPCGMKLCCNSFLNGFNSVSINMAKNQNFALNPNKINGVCGRLLCCLSYENEVYTSLKKMMPKMGTKIKFNDVVGDVISFNLLTESFVLNTSDGEIEIKLGDKYEVIK